MTCPICHKSSTPDFKPFCSKRCANVDLNGWLSDKYAIPSENPPEDEELEMLIEALESQANTQH